MKSLTCPNWQALPREKEKSESSFATEPEDHQWKPFHPRIVYT